eukprot:gene12076-12216_t
MGLTPKALADSQTPSTPFHPPNSRGETEKEKVAEKEKEETGEAEEDGEGQVEGEATREKEEEEEEQEVEGDDDEEEEEEEEEEVEGDDDEVEEEEEGDEKEEEAKDNAKKGDAEVKRKGESKSLSISAAAADVNTSTAADNFKVFQKSVMPVLRRFGMSTSLLTTVGDHIQRGHPMHRGTVSLQSVTDQVHQLCDSSLPEQFLQGLLTCYLAACWVLEMGSLPLQWISESHSCRGPDVEIKSKRVAHVGMSRTGDLMAAVRRKSQWLSVMGDVSTKDVLQQCPWLQLPRTPSGIAQAPSNHLTMDLYVLAACSSRKSILALKAEVLPAIEQAVEELYQGRGAPGLRLAAAAGIAINNFLFSTGPSGGKEVHGLARLCHMALHGAPITFRKLSLLTYLADVDPNQSSSKAKSLQQAAELLKSEDSEDDDPEEVRKGSASLVEALIQQGGPYWVQAVRGSAPAAIATRLAGGQRKDDSTWVFNFPLLIKKTPQLRLLLEKQVYIRLMDSSDACVRMSAMRSNGASARSSMSEEDESDDDNDDDEEPGQQAREKARESLPETKPKPNERMPDAQQLGSVSKTLVAVIVLFVPGVGSGAADSNLAELIAGLASVLEDPALTLVVQDARQDVARLAAGPFHIVNSNIIDTQRCFLLLEAHRAQLGLAAPPQMLRSRLEVLLSCYGLQHTNKLDVVAMSRADHSMWLTAPRPLSPQLLTYVVDDVRYLPALVMLMERDLLRLAPGAFIRELQPKLPAKEFHTPPGSVTPFSEADLLPDLAARLQAAAGNTYNSNVYVAPAASLTAPRNIFGAAGRPGSSSIMDVNSSAPSGSSLSRGWSEPSLSDTSINKLLFRLLSSLIRDAAAVLSDGWLCDVAVVDLLGHTGGSAAGGPSQTSFIGSALHLPVDTAAAQAAAITTAWQLHGCSVVLLEQMLHGPEVVAAVKAALLAGVRVIAAADDKSCWSDIMQLSSASDGMSRQHFQLQGPQQQGLEDQQHQLAAAAAIQMLVHLSSIGGKCAVVECLPGYRWHVHSDMLQLLQQHLSTSYSQPGAEVRRLANGDVLTPAAYIDGSGVLHEAEPQKQQRRHELEVIVQFPTYAGATLLSLRLLLVTKQLLQL